MTSEPSSYRRLIFLGSARVGKTSLIRRILNDSFDFKYNPTTEEFHKKVVSLKDGGQLSLEIIDTSGSQDFPVMRSLAIQRGEAFVLVFSYDQDGSFEEVQMLRETIQNIHPNAFFIVVGNKFDLPERYMLPEVADSLVCCDWELPFVNCSALTGHNVMTIPEKIASAWGYAFVDEQTERRPSIYGRRLSLPIFNNSRLLNRRRSSGSGQQKSCLVQ